MLEACAGGLHRCKEGLWAAEGGLLEPRQENWAEWEKAEHSGMRRSLKSVRFPVIAVMALGISRRCVTHDEMLL